MATFAFDFNNQIIDIEAPDTSITIQELINEIRYQEASELGIAYSQIAQASGKEELSEGVAVGITLMLLENWQVRWYAGSYTATIGGGNIVSAVGDPVAYREGGPQVEITLSAAATIVTEGGSVPTAEEIATEILDTQNIEGTVSLRELQRILLAVAAGKTVITEGDPTTVVFRDQADTKDRLSAEMDGSERTSVTIDGS